MQLLYFGDRPDKAAAFKLFGNMAIFFVTAGLADIYNLGAGLGIDPKEVHALFDNFKPANQIDVRGKKMVQQIDLFTTPLAHQSRLPVSSCLQALR